MPRYNGGFIGTDGLDAPDAPTIGTPSADSSQADIAFTAGTAGTTATTEFVATTNDGIGATGTSSPITITGLTNGTSYTARVYAKNSHGTSAASEASASFTPVSTVVDGLFKTHLYTGNGAVLDVTNNVDLTKGGLVWIKNRETTGAHLLWSNETTGNLNSTNTDALNNTSLQPTFNNDGFTFPSSDWVSLNENNDTFVSWTFRKQPKFFDIVTYTGTGSAQNISHNLGSVPGMIIVKLTSGSDAWHVYHRGVNGGSSPEDWYLQLNNTDQQIDNATIWNDTAPTSSVFTVGTNGGVNGSGDSYVAYLFAHNNNDGGFGETDDQDIIKCGNYTGNASTDGVTVDLGFEPQWLLFKDTSNTSSKDWIIIDNMRGMVVDNDNDNADVYLRPNTNGQEGASTIVEPTATGFKVQNNGWTDTTNANIVYVAIRKGGMRTPTAASDVFAISTANGGGSISTGFDADFALSGRRVDFPNWYLGTRLTGNKKYLHSEVANSEGTYDGWVWDSPSGTFEQNMNNTEVIDYVWARAKSYFDVVLYDGNGSVRTINHNLGVAPEMMWIKRRSGATNWGVYYGDNTDGLILNANAATSDNANFWNDTSPTSSVFTLGTENDLNKSGETYIAYLFATASGVSKVGTFTQNGATNVDCGFSGSTPAFVLLKRYDSTGDWVIFDSVRGIASGNDTSQLLNASDAEITNTDLIDPYSGGFATTSSITNGSYLFYAIAAIS